MIKLELSESELKALSALMDAGVRQLGLQSVQAAAALVEKLAAAERAAQTETKAAEQKVSE